MKVLFVTPWVPGPVRPRARTMIDIVAERHDVRVVAVERDDAEHRAASVLARRVPVTTVRNRRLPSYARAAGALPTQRALQSAYADVPALRAAVRDIVAQFRPDIVHLSVLRTVHLVDEAGSCPVVVDLDEFRSRYFAEAARLGVGPSGALQQLEARRAAILERELLTRPVAVTVSSPSDVVHPHVSLVSSPIDLVEWNVAPAAPPVGLGRRLLFAGRLHQPANADALDWFASSCLPTIRAEASDVRLLVAGERPGRGARRLAEHGLAELWADPPDLRDAYACSQVALVPVRAATGVQLKLLQAFAASVPAVTTPDCATRAGVEPGVHCLVATTPREWVAAVRELLENPGLAAALAGAAKAWVRQHHGRDTVSRQLEAAFDAALRLLATSPAPHLRAAVHA